MSDEWGPWIESARRAVIYFPETGRFVWVSKPETSQENRRWNARYAGTAAFDSFTKRGYLAGRPARRLKSRLDIQKGTGHERQCRVG